MQGVLSAFNIYNRNNGINHDNNLIRRALHIWKKNAKKKQIENATKIINSNYGNSMPIKLITILILLKILKSQ